MLIPFSFMHDILNNINVFTPVLTSFVIAPHGITDLIHAEENDKKREVHLTYLSTFFSSFLINTMNPDLFDLIFLIFSVIHFSHDLPIKNRKIQLLVSSLLTSQLDNIDISYFILYMILVHVPNHYNRFNNLLSKYKDKSIIFIFGIGLLIFSFLQKDPTLIEDLNVISIGKYIIIGHIIYEEFYTKENFNHFQI